MTRHGRLGPLSSALAGAVALLAMLALLASAPGPAHGSTEAPVCGAMQHVLDANGTPVGPVDARQPLLLVHGFDGSPSSTWGGSGLADELEAPGSGFFVGLFDYSYQDKLNEQWVTATPISGTTASGQSGQLADAIDCMAQESRAAGGSGKVIIVAYSMGGLAAQQAISEQVSGREVASEVGGLVSIGTPWQGVDPNFDLTTMLISYFCDASSWLGASFLSLAGDACLAFLANLGQDSPAARAMLPAADGGLSSQLRNLPKLPAGFPVLAVAGNMSWSAHRLDQTQVYQGSDGVVSVGSATSPPMSAGASQPDTMVIPCAAATLNAPSKGSDDTSSFWSRLASCFHVTLPSDPDIAQRVIPALAKWQAALAKGAPEAMTGNYTLYRRNTQCVNFAHGCGVSPMQVSISCAGIRCTITRTNRSGVLGPWVTSLPLTFDGQAWRASGSEDNASDCDSRPAPTTVAFTLEVVSGAVTTSLWKASQLRGTYSSDQGPTACNQQTDSIGDYVVSTRPIPGASATPAPSPTPTPSASPPPSASPSPSALTGTWTGSYVCAQGKTGLRLAINATAGGTLTATFNFYPLPDNPGVPSGSFTMTGTYSAAGVTLTHSQWINQPSGYEMVDIAAEMPAQGGKTLNGTITSCDTAFTLARSASA